MHNLHIFRNQTCEYDKIIPLENGTLVTFVNNCLYAMIEQLNNFTCYVESRMVTLNRKIDICYSNLVILEMKLNSINVPNQVDHAEKGHHLSEGSTAEESAVIASTNNNQHLDQNNSVNVSHDELDATQKTEPPDHSQESEEQTATPEVEDLAEELEKYRKMLRFGVNENAVRQKMLFDGEDPSRLNL